MTSRYRGHLSRPGSFRFCYQQHTTKNVDSRQSVCTPIAQLKCPGRSGCEWQNKDSVKCQQVYNLRQRVYSFRRLQGNQYHFFAVWDLLCLHKIRHYKDSRVFDICLLLSRGRFNEVWSYCSRKSLYQRPRSKRRSRCLSPVCRSSRHKRGSDEQHLWKYFQERWSRLTANEAVSTEKNRTMHSSCQVDFYARGSSQLPRSSF